MASEPNTTARILGYLHNLNTRLIVVERRLHTLDDKIDNVSDQLGNAIALLRKDKLENFKVGRGTVLEDKLLRVSGKQYFHSPYRTVSSKRARELIKASLTQREYEGREEKLVSWIKEKFCQWRQEERRKILAKDNGMTKYGTMDTESLVISMCRNKRIKHDMVSMSEVALMPGNTALRASLTTMGWVVYADFLQPPDVPGLRLQWGQTWPGTMQGFTISTVCEL
ncbi:uncharacterized protein [Ptychodera flava]|uniref:uncharacterized protein n=1 Tax=Ptychodera flava TaxID=63121 RepID=UPI00396A1B92